MVSKKAWGWMVTAAQSSHRLMWSAFGAPETWCRPVQGRRTRGNAKRTWCWIVVGLSAAAAQAQAQTGGSITAISVCGAGTVSSTSCPGGTFDTQEVVLAAGTNGLPLNEWNLGNAVDEHSSVFPPYSLGGNPDYLFFVASGTQPLSWTFDSLFIHNPIDIGTVVLSGRPDKNGQWRMTFASGYNSTYGDPTAGATYVGQEFLAPTGEDTCPTVSDRTFDLNYAAPGSVVADPTGAPGSLLMVYEGVNGCWSSGTKIMLGVATSSDNGHSWPAYAGTGFFFPPPLPYQNPAQGPDVSNAGAFGDAVCMGADCLSPKPYAGYGRYPVLSPPSGAGTRDSQPSAFVDNVQSGAPIYLYTVQDYIPGVPLPDGRDYDITIARAPLNGGSGPLMFEKWNGGSCGSASCWAGAADGKTLNEAQEYPILGDGDFTACGDAVVQKRSSPSISYVEATHQYLLTFVCASHGDPALGQDVPAAPAGAAWFYSTSPSLADPTHWSTPTEIIGSWQPFSFSDFYNGWYPTFMSPKQSPGRLKARGYAFYLWGCEGGGCGGRHFTSRRFAIQTTDNVYSRPPVVTFTGTTTALNSTGTVTLSFRSNEAGSAFECDVDGEGYAPCQSPATFGLAVGANTISVRAINPFGMSGRAATVNVTYKPLPAAP